MLLIAQGEELPDIEYHHVKSEAGYLGGISLVVSEGIYVHNSLVLGRAPARYFNRCIDEKRVL